MLKRICIKNNKIRNAFLMAAFIVDVVFQSRVIIFRRKICSYFIESKET